MIQLSKNAQTLLRALASADEPQPFHRLMLELPATSGPRYLTSFALTTLKVHRLIYKRADGKFEITDAGQNEVTWRDA